MLPKFTDGSKLGIEKGDSIYARVLPNVSQPETMPDLLRVPITTTGV